MIGNKIEDCRREINRLNNNYVSRYEGLKGVRFILSESEKIYPGDETAYDVVAVRGEESWSLAYCATPAQCHSNVNSFLAGASAATRHRKQPLCEGESNNE